MVSRIAAAGLGLVVAACEQKPADAPQQEAISYAHYEPGAVATPSNPWSFQLINTGGPRRFAAFQQLITRFGNKCDRVTSAVLKGGMDKADEWRVNCANSGNWSIWFQGDRKVEITRCSTGECL